MKNQSNKIKNFEKPPFSYWVSSTNIKSYPILEKDIKKDAVIVGGGLFGITAAYLLKKSGLKVAILEAGKILNQTSAHTTAKITSQHNLIYEKARKNFGDEKTCQYAQANEQAITFIENLVREKNIDCDFKRCPAYVFTQKEEYVPDLEKEVESAKISGINASFHNELPLPFEVKAGIRFENQARFHPLKYLTSLLEEFYDEENLIYENTRAIDIKNGSEKKVITNEGKTVTAPNIIIASQYPFFDGGGLYFSRLYGERSYILCIKSSDKLADAMYINAEYPRRSMRLQKVNNEEMILLAGENHRTGQGKDTNIHYENLMNFAQTTFNICDVPYRWSSQDYSTPDGIPYTGLLNSKSQGIYVATGFGKWGMSNGTASAIIIKDIITTGKSPWEDVYKPSRFTPKASAKSFIMENLDTAKELISGKLSKVPENLDIKEGEGGTFEKDGQKIGAYMDEKGELHLVDTTCTHLKCELKWNSAEKSWDCPCHASRFRPDGSVIEGPALKPLTKIDIEYKK